MTEKNPAVREILVAVCGLTPQVVTETLYYLTQVRKPPSEIREIFIITTGDGAEKAATSLLAKPGGKFHELCSEYGLNDILFDKERIHTVKGPDGIALSDIRTEGDNQLMADAIVNLIREKTEERDTVLHCSVAGGRKTMSIYLAYALLLFGRPGDTLSHVLVHPDFETHPEFYYIPRNNRTLDGSGKKKTLHTKDAWISVAPVPYVRLRDKVRDLFGVAKLSYGDMVKSTQAEIDSLRDIDPLEIILEKGIARIGTRKINMPDQEIALYAWFAGEKLNNCRVGERQFCGECSECFTNRLSIGDNIEMIIENYERARGRSAGRTERKGEKMAEYFLSKRSRINKKIMEAMGDGSSSNLYLISTERDYGNTRYGIRLDRRKIAVH